MTVVCNNPTETAAERTIRLLNEEIASLRQRVDEGDQRERGLEAAAVVAAGRFAERGELLDEVNHRAKNSIQMAISLLDLQRLASPQPEVREALGQAIERLHHVARVHAMLYGHSPDEQSIDFAVYLRTVCAELLGAQSEHARVLVEADPLSLDTPRAINLALIAGEAITNALKHAFPDGRTGVVRVECRRDDREATLTISDDGIGLSAANHEGALGMRLIGTLSKGIDGRVSFDGTNGTTVTVTFPV